MSICPCEQKLAFQSHYKVHDIDYTESQSMYMQSKFIISKTYNEKR